MLVHIAHGTINCLVNTMDIQSICPEVIDGRHGSVIQFSTEETDPLYLEIPAHIVCTEIEKALDIPMNHDWFKDIAVKHNERLTTLENYREDMEARNREGASIQALATRLRRVEDVCGMTKAQHDPDLPPHNPRENHPHPENAC